jgi:hypothetical protein
MSTVHERLKNTPYESQAYATRPSASTLYWRRSLIKQLIQFFTLNLKIMRIVVGGHS